ncbi:PrsW family intramembrane metalloprotease [Streptomyces sp. NRRL F-5630]|uniref:PrsW family intramembrane metalloprotease n=1 Tax=Streptomyces sp. NRRL F-5630 TaxID=1463864 RepID=UPI003EBDB480
MSTPSAPPPAPGPVPEHAESPETGIRPGLWRHWLWIGAVLWALTAGVTYLTKNTALLPTLILLGSFLVPVTFALWAYERHGEGLGLHPLLSCFVSGGVLGVLGSSLAEYFLLHPSVRVYAAVGLIEEAVKLLLLAWLVRRSHWLYGARAGAVLGGAVGFGFAAFETSGYAFNAALSFGGINLRLLLQTEILRAVLAPFGHGLWTALAGAVLLAHRGPDGRYRLSLAVPVAYLGVSALHALWDSVHGIALWLTERVTGRPVRGSASTRDVLVDATSEQRHYYTLFTVLGFALITALALAWGRAMTRRDPTWTHTP